jgi:hypothetical protein
MRAVHMSYSARPLTHTSESVLPPDMPVSVLPPDAPVSYLWMPVSCPPAPTQQFVETMCVSFSPVKFHPVILAF